MKSNDIVWNLMINNESSYTASDFWLREHLGKQFSNAINVNFIINLPFVWCACACYSFISE